VSDLTIETLSDQEVRDLCREWQEHLTNLEGKVRPDYLSIARAAVTPDNFGWEQGQLRPNRELAQYDLYYTLVPADGVTDALLISRLTETQMRRAFEQENPTEENTRDYDVRMMRLRVGLAELGYQAQL
jgi:hypothetical protein